LKHGCRAFSCLLLVLGWFLLLLGGVGQICKKKHSAAKPQTVSRSVNGTHRTGKRLKRSREIGVKYTKIVVDGLTRWSGNCTMQRQNKTNGTAQVLARPARDQWQTIPPENPAAAGVKT
jgi:hypothetical protein